MVGQLAIGTNTSDTHIGLYAELGNNYHLKQQRSGVHTGGPQFQLPPGLRFRSMRINASRAQTSISISPNTRSIRPVLQLKEVFLAAFRFSVVVLPSLPRSPKSPCPLSNQASAISAKLCPCSPAISTTDSAASVARRSTRSGALPSDIRELLHVPAQVPVR